MHMGQIAQDEENGQNVSYFFWSFSLTKRLDICDAVVFFKLYIILFFFQLSWFHFPKRLSATEGRQGCVRQVAVNLLSRRLRTGAVARQVTSYQGGGGHWHKRDHLKER